MICFSCPECAAQITFPDETAGKPRFCKQCGARLRVPSIEAVVAAEPVAVRKPPKYRSYRWLILGASAGLAALLLAGFIASAYLALNRGPATSVRSGPPIASREEISFVVEGAWICKPGTQRFHGEWESDEPILRIDIRTSNLTENKIADYRPSHNGFAPYVLTDNFGNRYFSHSIVALPANQMSYGKELRPGESCSDFLIFKAPLGHATSLRLSVEGKILSLSGGGDVGNRTFDIPTSSIKDWPPR